MTRPRSKTLQCRQVRLASSRGYFCCSFWSLRERRRGTGLQRAPGPPAAGPHLTIAGAASSSIHPQLVPHPRGRDPCAGPHKVKFARLAPHAKSTVSRTMVVRPRAPPPTPSGRCPRTSSLTPNSKPLLLPRLRAETTADFLRELRPFAAKRHPPPQTTDGPLNQSKLGTGGARGQTASRANPYARWERAWPKELSPAPPVLPLARGRRRKLSQSSFELSGFPWGAEAAAEDGEGAGVGCGLGEERAEHGDTVPPPKGPRNPAVGSLGSPRMLLYSPRMLLYSPRMLLCRPADISTAHVSRVGSRVVGSVRSAVESQPRCLLELPLELPKTPAVQPGRHLHRLYGGEPYGARSGC
ncbi:hypothetical protein STEG23_012644 [Scotinomys teguina]